MGLLNQILRRAVRHPLRTAVIDDRGTTSYLRLALGSMVLARLIRETTSNPHVGLLLPTSAATPMAIFAAWLERRTVIPLNFLLSREELRYVIDHGGIDTILTVGPLLDFIGGEEVIPGHVRLIRLDRLRPPRIPPIVLPPRLDPQSIAAILYTSGTSGKPKGVMLTHDNLRCNVFGAIRHAGLCTEDVFLGVLPQFHSFGLTALTLAPLALGARVIYTARFIPRKVVELIREHRPGVFIAIPSMYNALLSLKDIQPADFASIRMAVSGGEPLPAAVFDECLQRLNLRLLEGYGLTETSPVVSWCTPAQFRRGTVGRLLPGVSVKIVDDNDRPVPPGHDGEILIAGPNVMKGYYKDPAQTDLAFVRIAGRRYFRSGDIGRLDSAGFLSITGRKKEMLIIAGENVFPREIEEVINRHPAVRASAVIGKRDEVRGELPIAFVELNEGAAADEAELRGWCRQNLPAFKSPREIRIVPSLPRSPTGKIVRRLLQA